MIYSKNWLYYFRGEIFMNSLWLSNNKLINNNFIKEIDTSNTSNKTLLETDVCIVGAGIFGLTCAYYLSNLGYRVTVLEKR